MGLSAVKPKKPTLLEMVSTKINFSYLKSWLALLCTVNFVQLLAPEVRQEQNAILQCIHHVIKQDFFGLNS